MKSGQTVSAEEGKSLAGGHVWMSVLAGTVYERLSVLNNSRIAHKLWATPDVMDKV